MWSSSSLKKLPLHPDLPSSQQSPHTMLFSYFKQSLLQGFFTLQDSSTWLNLCNLIFFPKLLLSVRLKSTCLSFLFPKPFPTVFSLIIFTNSASLHLNLLPSFQADLTSQLLHSTKYSNASQRTPCPTFPYEKTWLQNSLTSLCETGHFRIHVNSSRPSVW